MGIVVWIGPGLLSGMVAKRPAGRRRGPPGLAIIRFPAWLTAIVGTAIRPAAYCLSGSRTAHVAAAAVGPTELGLLA